MKRTALVITVALLLAGGCSGMSATQQRTLTGGAGLLGGYA
jgi:hypothetical protein